MSSGFIHIEERCRHKNLLRFFKVDGLQFWLKKRIAGHVIDILRHTFKTFFLPVLSVSQLNTTYIEDDLTVGN